MIDCKKISGDNKMTFFGDHPLPGTAYMSGNPNCQVSVRSIFVMIFVFVYFILYRGPVTFDITLSNRGTQLFNLIGIILVVFSTNYVARRFSNAAADKSF